MQILVHEERYIFNSKIVDQSREVPMLNRFHIGHDKVYQSDKQSMSIPH